MRDGTTDRVGELADALRGDELLEVTATICAEVRLSGSDAEARSVQTVRSMLDDAGLATTVLEHDAYISLPVSARVVVGGEELPAITHSFSRATPSEGVTARLVDAGYDEPDHAAAAGATVLSDGIAMPGLVARNERAGAGAQIFVCAELTHEMCVSTVWGSPTPGDLDRLPRTTVVSVTERVGARLRELLAAGPVEVTVHAEVDTGWRTIRQLVADLCPPDVDDLAASGTPFVLFSGHLDSWHQGAMDNGGANAVMVTLARELARRRHALRRGLRLAFWSGHSHGRYAGSAWYVDEHHHELSTQCVAHVNIDSIGGLDSSILTDAVAMPVTHDCGAQAIAAETGQQLIGSRVSRSGDQSLVALGTPSLFMSLSEHPPSDSVTSRAFGGLVAGSRTGGLGWWWHTVADTLDKLDPARLERDGRVYARALAELLCAEVLPLRPDRQAAALLGELRDVARAARPWLDLDRTVRLAEQVDVDVTALQARRDGRTAETSADVLAVLAAVRPLVELSYAGSGAYAHDPTVPIPAVPQLAAAASLGELPAGERAATVVDLRRRRNYVEDRLREALRAVEEAMR